MLNQLADFPDFRSLNLQINAQDYPQFFNKVFPKLKRGFGKLRTFILDVFSQAEGAFKLAEIMKWVSSHPDLTYLHLEMPQKDYTGFEECLDCASNLKKPLRLHIVSQ